MAKHHPTEVASIATVVRSVLVEVEARGRTVPPAAWAALVAVEAWLAGDDITPLALQEAANLSNQDGVPYAAREKDRALEWARAAAGNLAWLAKKDRGWQTGDRSVMDAALYTLSTLGDDGVKTNEALEALRRDAAERAAAAPPRPRKLVRPKPRPTDLSAFIGAAAQKKLARRKPAFDPARHGDEDALRAVLVARGYVAHAPVLAFEARYGGLVVADAPGEEGYDWCFGAYACLTSDAHVDPRGEHPDWVPVAYSPDDAIFFLDGDGVAWAVDTVGDEGTTRFANDGDAMLARIVTGG